MDVKKAKQGKQRQFVNREVKELDEETVTGENLFGEPMNSFEVGKQSNIVQLGNLIVDRVHFYNPQDGRVYSAKGCCPTLTLGVPPKILIEDDGKYKVRELSGREGLMLMGVERDDVAKVAASGLSDAQMMKLAGNSIVVDVMSSFFGELVQC
jgi:hypothetical protein